jgi:4-hydroxy-4-methyl-2-oxoglutarate aldolase
MATQPSFAGPVVGDFERPAASLIAEAAKFGAATLHEASGKIGVVPPRIKPVHPDFKICGPAFTVLAAPGDNLWLHRALAAAKPGDILFCGVGDRPEYGYFGEIMAHTAKARGLGGLVIDGCVRDGALLPEIGFPVFATGLCIRGTSKDDRLGGWLNLPLSIGEVRIFPGDLVVGDADGVVVLPREGLAENLKKSAARDEAEAKRIAEIKSGKIQSRY